MIDIQSVVKLNLEITAESMMVNHNPTKPPNSEVDTGLQKREFQPQLHSFNKVSFSPHVSGTGIRALSKVGKVTVPVEVMVQRRQTLNKSTT